MRSRKTPCRRRVCRILKCSAQIIVFLYEEGHESEVFASVLNLKASVKCPRILQMSPSISKKKGNISRSSVVMYEVEAADTRGAVLAEELKIIEM